MDNMKRELLERAATAGVNVSGKAVQNRIDTAKERAREEARTTSNFNPAIKEKMSWLLGWTAIIFSAIFLFGGIIGTTLAVPITETVAVQEGLEVIWGDESIPGLGVDIAFLNAATLVIGLILAFFWKWMVADTLEIIPGQTLANIWRGIRFFIGGSDSRVERSKSEESYLFAQSAIRFATISILLFGFLGRLRVLIVGAESWGEIAQGLSSPEYAIGLVGTAAVVFTLIRLTELIILLTYTIFVDAVGRISIGHEASESVLKELEQRFINEELERLVIQAEARQEQQES